MAWLEVAIDDDTRRREWADAQIGGATKLMARKRSSLTCHLQHLSL